MSAVIRLVTYEPEIISVEEYERMEREVIGRVLAQDVGVGDRVLARLLLEHRGRYMEAKEQNTRTSR